MDRIGVLLA